MPNPNLEEIDAPAPLTHVRFKGLERIRPVFFYQRRRDDFDEDEGGTDDLSFENDSRNKKYEIFACYEQEAATLNPKDFKQIGVGDGKAWAQSIKDSGVKRGDLITIEKQREILDNAFKAELEAARGHKMRPRGTHRFIGGVSKDIQNPEEIVNSFLGNKR